MLQEPWEFVKPSPASPWVGTRAANWTYLLALLAGMMLIVYVPELPLFLPRSAGVTFGV